METEFFKHVFTRLYQTTIGFSYWRQKRTMYEVDIVADTGSELTPFEVKYGANIKKADLMGFMRFALSTS